MSTSELRPIVPQHISLVVVFFGPDQLPIAESDLSKLMGRPPIGRGKFRGEEGELLRWDDGVQVLIRTQGPNRNRLEVQVIPPITPDFGPLSKVLIDILPMAGNRDPHSVGINYGAVVLNTPSTKDAAFDKLISRNQVTELFGRKQALTTEMKFTIPMRPKGVMNVILDSGDIVGSDQLTGMSITTNMSVDATTMQEVIQTISKERLGSVTRYISGLMHRIQRS